MNIAPYNLGYNRAEPSPTVLAMLTTRAALLARAAVRDAIAEQDQKYGDHHAFLNNKRIAAEMRARAEEMK